MCDICNKEFSKPTILCDNRYYYSENCTSENIVAVTFPNEKTKLCTDCSDGFMYIQYNKFCDKNNLRKQLRGRETSGKPIRHDFIKIRRLSIEKMGREYFHDFCVNCDKKTEYYCDTPISMRYNFINHYGQFCSNCY